MYIYVYIYIYIFILYVALVDALSLTKALPLEFPLRRFHGGLDRRGGGEYLGGGPPGVTTKLTSIICGSLLDARKDYSQIICIYIYIHTYIHTHTHMLLSC